MANSLLGKIATVVLVVGVVIAPAAEAGVTSRHNALNSRATTRVGRQMARTCPKGFSGQTAGVDNLKTLEGLPGKCDAVRFPYQISPSNDCNSVY